MSELGREPDPGGVSTFAPNLLEWIGATFGNGVERAKAQPLRLGRAQLEDLIRTLPAAIHEQRRERITVESPDDLWLDSTKSVVVAMVIHELATNAVKYGALSNGRGCVTVAWEQLTQPHRVKLIWRESGGPKVSPPKQKGFRIASDRSCFRGQPGSAQLVFNPQKRVLTKSSLARGLEASGSESGRTELPRFQPVWR